MSEIPRYQELLNELNRMDWRSLYQEGISATDRAAYIKLGKQRIRYVKNLIRQEKEFISVRYNNRDKIDSNLGQIAQLPYLALENTISKLELAIAELIAAIETNRPIPEGYVPGEMLVEERTANEILWQTMSRDEWEKRNAEKEQAREALLRSQMKQAQQLIAAKEYAQARTILQTIDHPKAQEWLKKVEELYGAHIQETLITELGKRGIKISSGDDRIFTVVCPKCGKQTTLGITINGVRHPLTCSHCGTSFEIAIYHIRASRSQSPGGIGRDYSVRVVESSGAEQLLTFSTLGVDTLELRSNDLAGFTYFQGRLIVVQNFTINRYWRIGWVPGKSLPVLQIVLVVLILLVLFVYFFVIQAR